MAELSTLGDVIKVAYEGESNTNAFTDAEKSKLSGIASGATVNSTDASLRARSSHTGTQDASTITGLSEVATSGAYGDLTGSPQGAAVADAASEEEVVQQFNSLLASLRAAGLIAS